MPKEKKIVTWSLLTLFLSLTIVYALTYMRKTDVFKVVDSQQKNEQKADEEPQVGSLNIPVIDMANPMEGTITGTGTDSSLFEQVVPPLPTGTVNPISTSSSTLTSSGVTNSNIPSDTGVLASTEPLRLLSGTTQFFGVLDIVDILGQSPEYTLQDTNEMYFVFYGSKGLDFVGTIQQLGGSVYTMATEREILENQLFGDKVSFINLAAFKDKHVFMVVEVEGRTWLIQIPAATYHTSKSYLKSLFI